MTKKPHIYIPVQVLSVVKECALRVYNPIKLNEAQKGGGKKREKKAEY